MSDLHTAIDARIEAFRPEQTPPFERLIARRRVRRAKSWVVGAVVVAAAVAVAAVGPLDSRRRSQDIGGVIADNGPVTGGNAGLGPGDIVTSVLRVLPSNALLQTTYTGGHAMETPPRLPTIELRLYDDGTLLSATGTSAADKWQRAQLSPEELLHVRRLIADAGLAVGGRDYGIPTNAGFFGGGIVYQVNSRAGAVASAVAYGGTVNGVVSSNAHLAQAQRDARARIDELNTLLASVAARATATYVPAQWSRYASRSAIPDGEVIDPTAYPAWAGPIALDSGLEGKDGLRCLPVPDPASDAQRTYFDGSYRVDTTAWDVRYDPVLPGEDACTAINNKRE